MLKFACPACGSVLELGDAYAGKKSQCPECEVRILVPPPGGKAQILKADGKAAPPSSGPARAPAPSKPRGKWDDMLGEEPPRADRVPAGPPMPAVLPHSDEPGRAESRPIPASWIGGGVAGVAVLGLVLWMVVGGGGGDSGDSLNRTSPRRESATNDAAGASATAAPTRTKMGPSQIVEKYGPAVVRIETAGENGKPLGTGSGFVVDARGIVVTNFHVIDQARSVSIKRKDGSSFPAAGVLAWDSKKDFAVLKAESPGDPWPTVALGNSEQLSSGARVVTIGSALGFDYTVSDGLFSGKADPGQASGHPIGVQYLQISAPISHGNSGGPLFDEYGEVVGINSMGFSGAVAQNLNFSLPINEVKPCLAEAEVHSIESVVQEGNKRSVAELLQTGSRMLSGKDRIRAYLMFKAAYEREPTNPDVCVGFGDALLGVGQHHLARERFEEALKLRPDNATAWRGLGSSYASTSDRPRAVLAFREALKRDAADPRALIGLASILASWRRPAEAVVLADRGIDKVGEDVILLEAAAAVYSRSKESAKADRCLERLPKGTEFDGARRVIRGIIAMEAGRPAEAVEQLSRAVEAEPQDPFLRLLLAQSLQADGKVDQAIAEYKQCLDLEGSLYPALKGLARIYDSQHLVLEALSLYRTCVQLSPTDLESNLRLAQLLGDIGKAEEAVPFLQTALEKSPGYRPCVLALAAAHAAANQRDKASDMLAPLVKAAPPDPEAQIALAEIYLEQGRPKDALELLRAAKVGGTMLGRKLFQLGRAFEAEKDYKSAAAAYDEAVSVDPERGGYRYMRAMAFARYNQRMGRAALEAYVDWAAKRQEEAERMDSARNVLEQMR